MTRTARQGRAFSCALVRGLCCGGAIAGAVSLAASLAAAQGPDRGAQIATGAGSGGVAQACFTCHGAKGGGDRASAMPRLAGLNAAYLAKQLDDYAGGGRESPIMRPIARSLSQEDRIAVARYYARLDDAAPPPLDAAEPRLNQRGAVLYAEGARSRGVQACRNCHGPSGKGLAPYPALAGQPSNYVTAQLEAWRNGTRNNDPHGMMKSVAERMSPEDIKAVATYLAELSP
ncbi:MAG: c-type cytochrome [Hyphomicrobiaceae bacterium]|nr:c-type cytochrome [Hyphomicrobiaceae bacterium]